MLYLDELKCAGEGKMWNFLCYSFDLLQFTSFATNKLIIYDMKVPYPKLSMLQGMVLSSFVV